MEAPYQYLTTEKLIEALEKDDAGKARFAKINKNIWTGNWASFLRNMYWVIGVYADNFSCRNAKMAKNILRGEIDFVRVFGPYSSPAIFRSSRSFCDLMEVVKQMEIVSDKEHRCHLVLFSKDYKCFCGVK